MLLPTSSPRPGRRGTRHDEGEKEIPPAAPSPGLIEREVSLSLINVPHRIHWALLPLIVLLFSASPALSSLAREKRRAGESFGVSLTFCRHLRGDPRRIHRERTRSSPPLIPRRSCGEEPPGHDVSSFHASSRVLFRRSSYRYSRFTADPGEAFTIAGKSFRSSFRGTKERKGRIRSKRVCIYVCVYTYMCIQ